MLKKAGIAVLAVILTANLYAIDFSVNGTPWKSRSGSELESLSYTIPFYGENMTGISLDELFPAAFEAWGLRIVSASGEELRFSDPELGDSLARYCLILKDSGWSLLYKNRVYEDIRSVELTGELLDDSPIEIWINWEGTELLRSEIERYAGLHEIDIKITEVPKPDSKLISVNQANGDVPDIIMVQSSYIDKLARSGSIQNIDYMYPEGIVAQGREAFSLNEKTWAVPFYYDAQMLFYNPELVEKPDENWSLNDFEELCGSALSMGVIPSAWNSYSASFLIPFQIAFGKNRLVETDGSIIIDDEASLAALEYVLHLQDKGLMQPMERDAMTSLFVAGKTAMIISASYSIPHFEQLGIPYAAAPLPINTANGRRVSPLLDFKAFAVTRRSHNSAGARRLIEYLCGTGVQQRFSSAVSKLPALEKAWLTAEEENPHYAPLSISSETGTIIPADKAFSVYKNTMWKMLRFAISGRMPAEQVLKKTQELVDKNLEDLN